MKRRNTPPGADGRVGERRRSRRHPASDSRLKTPTLEVRILDVSEGGLAIESHESLRVGDSYRFTPVGEGAGASFEARVLWCRLRQTRTTPQGDVVPVYRAGIAIRDLGSV